MDNLPQNTLVSIAPVDLGLSSGTLWAPMNIGAAKPEEYGDYFAWGETTAKDTYGWSTYKWMSEGETINKYTFADGKTEACWYDQDGNFIGDGRTTLDPEDDAATAAWGSDWRMPTNAEWEELNDECSWTWEAVNGVEGYTVTSKTNGNSLFLPAAGCRVGSDLHNSGPYGRYWCSELSFRSCYATDGLFESDLRIAADGGSQRCYGHSVRAVAAKVAAEQYENI